MLLALTLALAAAPVSQPSQDGDLEVWGFDLQLDATVVSATKTLERAASTAAVVTIISSEDISNHGYRSLADILGTVPGFYDNYDLVDHNFGVRGINGGQHASGSVLKVMIDGQAVDFRPSTGNFFDAELIPIALIDRVEVIRGPASALYGANAYLGVVNVITKNGEQLSGFRLAALGELVRTKPGGGGQAYVGGKEGRFDFVFGVSGQDIDRSGLSLPASSPLAKSSQLTRGDTLAPLSLFGKVTIDRVAWGTLTLSASVQRQDAAARFIDYSAVYGDTRVSLLNQNYRALYVAQLRDNVSLELSGGYFNGAPTTGAHVDIGRSDYMFLPQVGAEGGHGEASVRWQVFAPWALTVGGDYVNERHLLQSFEQRLTSDVIGANGEIVQRAGTIIPGSDVGQHRTFSNAGVYAQSVVQLHAWNFTVGGRLDDQNIYGANVSARAGVVYAPAELPVSLKLLYGSSYKAPTAEQLYAQPVSKFDISGNSALKAQTANNLEVSGSYRLPRDLGEVSLNIYGTRIDNRVEYIERGIFLVAQNLAAEWLIGGEAEARVIPVRALQLRLSASVVKTVARDVDPFLSAFPQADNPLFPQVIVHFIADYSLPFWAIKLSAQISYIGERGSSGSNSIASGNAYHLPAYPYTAFAAALPAQHWIGATETTLSLRVDNVINYRWAYGGFNGHDVPNQGITASAWWLQSF